jgi:two-component system phosphate regulon sensor histidine kinase PhoR
MAKIRWIIAMMTAALLGVLFIQFWSLWSMLQLNGELFDNNVKAALDNIVAKIEQKEIDQTAKLYNLPKPSEIGKEFAALVEVEEISTFLKKDQKQEQPTFSKADLPEKDSSQHKFFAQETRKIWKKGNKEAFMSHFTTYFTHHSIVQDIPLERRMSMAYVDSIIAHEFQAKDIDLKYVYAIYSNQKKQIILSNVEHYTDCRERYKAGLKEYRYHARLFPSSEELIGELHVDFPDRRLTNAWQSIGGSLLGTVLFMGVIIFCFYYTIVILFKQKKLSDMKNDFMNNMTHEFKTPIATISIATDAIENLVKNEKIDKIPRFVHIIKEENKRMNAQVEKVLQSALIDKKEFKLNIQTIDAHEIILNAAEKMALQVERKNGQLTLDLEASDSLIEADETHFTNIIHNLLDNANKYSPEAPQIRIRTRNLNNGLAIDIEDKGLGISKEARKQIFDKFYRVSTGNLHDIKGFGLGLSYVKAMMTAHAGQVEVKSELGKGSTFTLFFPMKQP